MILRNSYLYSHYTARGIPLQVTKSAKKITVPISLPDPAESHGERIPRLEGADAPGWGG